MLLCIIGKQGALHMSNDILTYKQYCDRFVSRQHPSNQRSMRTRARRNYAQGWYYREDGRMYRMHNDKESVFISAR